MVPHTVVIEHVHDLLRKGIFRIGPQLGDPLELVLASSDAAMVGVQLLLIARKWRHSRTDACIRLLRAGETTVDAFFDLILRLLLLS